MIEAARTAVLVLVGLMVGSVAAVACAGDDCQAGNEGCPCTFDDRCLEGLACLSDYCVDPNPQQTSGPGDSADGSSVDNVAACEAFVDTVSCGDVDLSQFLDCDIYADTVCDIADYFDCLSDNTSCTDGVFDNSQWPSCADLATCT